MNYYNLPKKNIFFLVNSEGCRPMVFAGPFWEARHGQRALADCVPAERWPRSADPKQTLRSLKVDLGDIIIYIYCITVYIIYIYYLYHVFLYYITLYILYNIMYTLYIYILYNYVHTHIRQLDFHMIQNVQTPPVGTPFWWCREPPTLEYLRSLSEKTSSDVSWRCWTAVFAGKLNMDINIDSMWERRLSFSLSFWSVPSFVIFVHKVHEPEPPFMQLYSCYMCVFSNKHGQRGCVHETWASYWSIMGRINWAFFRTSPRNHVDAQPLKPLFRLPSCSHV